MSKKKIFALIDCNNFFASCERVFSPEYKDRPVAVLSNNDGCIIARSNEVKALGVPMAAPFFKYKDLIQKYNVKVFSANFALYSDMSQRIMDTLRLFSPNIEIYSIDEAFLALEDLAVKDFNSYCRKIRDTVTQWTGIPISIGIATTKTLSKIANEIAKKDHSIDGVLDISAYSKKELDTLLKKIDVSDLWGIGWRLSDHLKQNGICNAFQLKNTDDKWVKKNLTVTGLRTTMELRGIPCIPLQQIMAPQKNIVRSRSFGRPVTSIKELSEAVATYASDAAAHLRAQGLLASTVIVYIVTNRFKKNQPQYYNSAQKALDSPTAFTPNLIKAAQECLKNIYKPGFLYKKAFVILTNLAPQAERQQTFFEQGNYSQKQQYLMHSVDLVNHKMARDTIRIARTGTEKHWAPKCMLKSPEYTTKWSEILSV